MTTTRLIAAANAWRDSYNPLRGLTISRAVELIEAYRRGELADIMWTFAEIEEADPDLLTIVNRRLSALEEYQWQCRASEDIADKHKALADEQAEALREAYERVGNIYETASHLLMSRFRGLAFAQPHLEPDGSFTHVELLDPWNFARDGSAGGFAFNPQARSVSYRALRTNEILPEHRLIVMESPRPVDRIGLVKFARSTIAERDWDAYVDIYGLPSCFVILPPNIPEPRVPEFRDAAQAAAEGGGGALPAGSEVKFPSEVRGSEPFRARLEWLQRQLVLAGTGGLLTMLAESGSGTLAGSAHMEAFRTLAAGDARRVSELIQQTLDRWILARTHPGQPRLAYWSLAVQEETDVGEIIDHATKLSSAGYRIDPRELSDRTGYTITLAPADATSPGFGPGLGLPLAAAHRADPDADLRPDYAAAPPDLAPAERIAAALRTPDAMLAGEIPALLDALEIDLSPDAAADEIETLLAEAFAAEAAIPPAATVDPQDRAPTPSANPAGGTP